MRSSWQDNRKHIFVRVIAYGNLAIMAGNDAFCNRKTKAKMSVVLPRFVCTVKALEQFVTDLFRNRITGICYREIKFVVVDTGMNFNRAMFRGIA